uniref:L-Fucosyltransferase n=1 Tax=Heligmosomoides polygyrus TaxID=6339 RepID=A0A183FGY2_HELPZ
LLDDLFYIGVHVRRGMDIEMNGRNIEHGHQAAPADYYKKAMEFAKGDREKVITFDTHLMSAQKRKEISDSGMIFFCPGVHREVDMAILAQCDALVLSTGTFSWWSGFLNQKSSQVNHYKYQVSVLAKVLLQRISEARL